MFRIAFGIFNLITGTALGLALVIVLFMFLVAAMIGGIISIIRNSN